MAGRPKRRARREAVQRALSQLPEPSKPLAEMTLAERAAYAAAVRRALRDVEVIQGSRKPRSMRDVETWREAHADGDAQSLGLTGQIPKPRVSADGEDPSASTPR
jgi:hypothetical protein